MNRAHFYNPFIYIAGYKSLFWGLAGLFLTSYFAFTSGTHFNGILNISLAKDADFWIYLIENVSQWIFLSTFLFIAGLVLSKSKIRGIDIFGTTLFSRIPLIITPLIRAIPFFQSFAYQSPAMYLIIAIYGISLIWSIVLFFNAYKVSSNLKKENLIISFVVCMILSETITKLFLYFFYLK